MTGSTSNTSPEKTIWIGDATIPLANIEFLGRCYDARLLDPMEMGGSRGTMIHTAFDLGASELEDLPSWQAKVPKGTQYKPLSHGQWDTSTLEMFCAWDYQQTFKVSVEADVVVASASASYESFRQESGSKRNMMTYTEVVVEDFEMALILEDSDNLHLTSGPGSFRHAVFKLIERQKANKLTDNHLDAFVMEFGTHFADHVVFGGRAYQTITISAQTYSTLEREGVTVKAGAKASFGSASSEISREQQRKFESATEGRASRIVTNGGTGPLEDFNRWAETVRKDPAPVKLHLERLSTLIRRRWFPEFADDPGEPVKRTRQRLNEFIDAYLDQDSADAPQLRFKWATVLDLVWWDKGSRGKYDGSYYAPGTRGTDFLAVGHYAQSDYESPTGSLLLVAPVPQQLGDTRPTLAHPAHFEEIWTDKGSGAHSDGSFWRPSPPPGYVSLGDVAMTGYHTPPRPTDVWCVREDLAAPGALGDMAWVDTDTGADKDFGSWHIVPADDASGINAGTFWSQAGKGAHQKPSSAEVFVLKKSAV